MTTLTDRLPFPNLRRVYLIEATAGEKIAFWTQDGTYTNVWYGDRNSTGKVLGIKEDGVDLAAASSVSDANTTDGSYFVDGTTVYVNPTAATPYDATIQATAQFTFGNFPRVYNGIYYDPRIKSLPNLSLRVEPRFGSVGQIGSGQLTLANQDGFFDAFALQWDAGLVVLKMGIDPTGGECAYADFDVVGTWRIKRWETSDDKFVLYFAEVKEHVKKKIPLEFYTREVYPTMEDENEGNPIQIAYGLILDVRPVCIDLSTNQFKLAGHAITEFLNARLLNEATGRWYTCSVTDIDLDNATIKIPEWDQTQGIAVDFRGKRVAGVGPPYELMSNPADIVRDLLQTYLGITDAEIDDA